MREPAPLREWSESAIAAVLAQVAFVTPVVASFDAVRNHVGRAHYGGGARDRVSDDGSSSHSSGSQRHLNLLR